MNSTVVPALMMFNTALRREVPARVFDDLHRVGAALRVTVGFNLLTDSRTAARAVAVQDCDLPKINNVTLDEKTGGVGVAISVNDLLKWTLNTFGELRSAINSTETDRLLIKINDDGVVAIAGGNVTVLSIQIVLPGLGASVATIQPVVVYRGGDHAPEASVHLKLSFDEVDNLKTEGLFGVAKAQGDVEAPIPCTFIATLDGAAQRENTGTSTAAALYPIPGLFVTSSGLGKDMLRRHELNRDQDGLDSIVELCATVWPYKVADNEANRRKFANENFGKHHRNIMGMPHEIVPPGPMHIDQGHRRVNFCARVIQRQ